MGIEPTYPAWKAGVLPLNYTRISLCLRCVCVSLASTILSISYYSVFVNRFFDFFQFFLFYIFSCFYIINPQFSQSQTSAFETALLDFLITSSGLLALTLVLAGIDSVINVLPPMIVFSPITVSPPSTEAFE